MVGLCGFLFFFGRKVVECLLLYFLDGHGWESSR